MARSERTTNAIEDALNAAQVEFSVNPLFMAPQTKQVLQAQERMLDEAEKFWSAWFQRRQDATQSMIDAGRRIASGGPTDPAGAMKEIVDWQIRSMERLAEDGKHCTEMLSRCAGALLDKEAKGRKGDSGAVKRATKPRESAPA
ncbi:MAG: hypothetical protein KDK29_05955 [Sedimentitalea sp.]|nr:hypothetical protein [Sedimentitalea sp.]